LYSGNHRRGFLEYNIAKCPPEGDPPLAERLQNAKVKIFSVFGVFVDILPQTTESHGCKAVDECISKDPKGKPQRHGCKPVVRGLHFLIFAPPFCIFSAKGESFALGESTSGGASGGHSVLSHCA